MFILGFAFYYALFKARDLIAGSHRRFWIVGPLLTGVVCIALVKLVGKPQKRDVQR